MHYLDDPFDSIPTTDLPTTKGSSEGHLMTMETRGGQYLAGIVPPSRDFTNRRPGWAGTRAVPGNSALKRPYTDNMLCYNCYGRHYLSVECTLPNKDIYKIILNYEDLMEDDRNRVLATFY